MAVIGDESVIAAANDDESQNPLPEDAIVIVEVADSGVHWQEPGDLLTDGSCTKPGAEPRLGGSPLGFHVAFFDGEVWRLHPDTPVDLVMTFFTVDGALEFDREAVLGKYRVEFE